MYVDKIFNNTQIVTVVLVNYNGRKYLNDCVESILKQDYSSIEIIVVDNASTDDSIVALKSFYPYIPVIKLEKNEGFGQGCNVGMQYAFEHGADYALLLNVDTIIEADMITRLLQYANQQTVVAPYMYTLSKNGEKKEWYAGGSYDAATGEVTQLLYANAERVNKYYEVNFISGCCMLIHKEIISQVGGFEANFFLYYEDVDFCVKLQMNGIKMFYVPAAKLWHRVGGSSGGEVSCASQYFGCRNSLFIAQKYKEILKTDPYKLLCAVLEKRDYLKPNAPYNRYIQAAIMDFFEGYMDKGYYGRMLLEDNCYIKREFDVFGCYAFDEIYSILQGQNDSLVIVNPKKNSREFCLSFGVELVNPFVRGKIQMFLDKTECVYTVPGKITMTVSMSPESIKVIPIKIFEEKMQDKVELPGEIKIALKEYIARILNLRLEERDK